MFTAKTLVDDKVAGFEAGADDYLTKPTHPAELASRVKAMLARSASQRRPETNRSQTIGVLGAKGGVGTTTLALNMAAALVMSGENPIVTDFRLGAGSLALMLGADGITGLANVLGKPAAEIQPSLIEGELILHTSNLRALVSSSQSREALLKYPIESAVALINGLRTLGRPAIFDLGSNYSETISRLQREMDQIVLVVDPSSVTISLARELMHELGESDRVNVVVVNRQQSNNQLPWNEVEQMLNHELRAIISESSDLALKAVQNTTPMVMLQPNSIIANQIVKLCTDLTVSARSVAGRQLTP
jgi:pilus assembly protein CpaE